MAPTGRGSNVPKHARHSSTSEDLDPSDYDEKQEINLFWQEQAQSGDSEDGEDMGACEDGSDTASKPTEATSYTTQPTQAPEYMISMSEMEELTKNVVCQCIITGIAPDGTKIALCFAKASVEPPVTAESLSELDMNRIINNPRLRQDVNFDRELHFRPNLDGSKGKEKIKKAGDYWKALEGELFMYGFVQGRMKDSSTLQDEVYWKDVLASSEKRLPKVFDACRDILKTLVPDGDREAVTERLDSKFMMQQIKHGVCDLVDLAHWFGKVLKNHCAPMRDHNVDHMRDEMKRGATEEKADVLVNGIRQLMAMLEVMKLDVANHQIRHMRALLIEDTLNFQRRYNAYRISVNKIDVEGSRAWLKHEMAQMTAKHGAADPLDALASALLRGILCNNIDALYPATFYLDSERLLALRIDLQSNIYLDLCGGILTEVTSTFAPKATELVKAIAHLRKSVQAITGPSYKYLDRIENIAAEIMRMVLMLEGRTHPSDLRLFGYIEDRLMEELRPGSRAFERRAHETLDRILPKVLASVDQHINLAALQLQDRLVPAIPLPSTRPFGFGARCAPVADISEADLDDDVVRKLTHMIVLHWQVWADLVYLEPATEEEIALGLRSPPLPVAPPGTVPVAQAVYAPGRKWLPIGVIVTDVPTGAAAPTTPPDSDSHTSASDSQPAGPDAQPRAEDSQPPEGREGNESPDPSEGSSDHSAMDSEQHQQT